MVNLKPSGYIIGILVFVFFIVSGMTMIMEFKASKSDFATEERFSSFNSTFNVYDDVNESIGGMKAGIIDSEPQFGVFGVLNALIETSWNTLKLLFTSFGFMDAVFNGLSTEFGVPTYIGALIILGIVVVFIFSIFSAVFQREL